MNNKNNKTSVETENKEFKGNVKDELKKKNSEKPLKHNPFDKLKDLLKDKK